MKSLFMTRYFLNTCKIIFFLSIPFVSFSQSVGIGTSTPHASALLEIKSTSKGILIPRTSSITRAAIVGPARSLMLYDTTTNSFWFYSGSDWIESGRIDPSLVNTFFGFQTGSSINTGVANTGVGHQALWSNTDGGFNTALGYSSLILNTTGQFNTAVGNNSLHDNTTGMENTALASHSLFHNTTGKDNSAVGYSSLYSNTTGNNNSALGVESMHNNIGGSNNTAGGYRALYNNLSGYANVALGANALFTNISGFSNVAIGPSSLFSNNAGTNNVGLGDSALYNTTNGTGNIGVGSKVLFTNTTGVYNVAIGVQTLYNNNADQNIAIGYASMANNTTGGGNLGIGSQALAGNIAGSNNIGIGNVSGSQIRASNNTIIGGVANVGSSSVANSSALGWQAVVGCSNCIALGGTTANGAQTRVGINNTTPVTDLHIIQQSANNADNTRGIRLQSPNGNQWRVFLDPSNNYIFQYNNSLYSYIEPVGGAFVNASDEGLKQDILPLDNILDKTLQLHPKTYYYINSENKDRRSYGFLAQDVEKFFPEFVFTSESGYKGIAYSNFSVIAIKAIQEQQTLIESLQKKNEELEQRILALEKK